MPHHLLDIDSCRICVIDPSGGVRSTIREILSEHGYRNIQLFSTIQEAKVARIFDHNRTEWIFSSIQSNTEVNIFNIISNLPKDPTTNGIHFSLLFEHDEEEHLIAAFEMGIFSWHQKPVTQEALQRGIDKLIKRLGKFKESALVAAFDVRTILKKNERFEDLINLEQSLFQIYPHSDILLHRAHAQLMAGHENEALMLLHDVNRIDPSLKDRVQTLISDFTKNDHIDEIVKLGFKLDHLIIVDSDESVIQSLREIGLTLGALNIIAIPTAKEALEWVKENESWLNDPKQLHLFVIEWRHQDMSGNIFIQHLRLSGLRRTPIVIASSLLERKDEAILAEVGISAVFSKPIKQNECLALLINVIRADITPNEKIHFEQKIRNLIRNNNLDEANRFLIEYCANSKISAGDKLKIRADLSYAEGLFEHSKNQLMRGIRMSGVDTTSINLLGKCLMQLQDFSNAKKCFYRAQDLSPQNIDRMINLAISEVNSGNSDLADNTISEVRALGVDNDILLPVEAKIAVSKGAPITSQDIWENENAVTSIAAFINNQAVVYARHGDLDDSIETYRKALETIPNNQKEMRYIINYNLGLAYVRGSDLNKALETLNECIKDNTNKSLHKKVKGLLNNVQRAIKTGRELTFATTNATEMSMGSSEEQAELELFVDEIQIKPGSFCLYGIFRPSALMTSKPLNILTKKLNNKIA